MGFEVEDGGDDRDPFLRLRRRAERSVSGADIKVDVDCLEMG